MRRETTVLLFVILALTLMGVLMGFSAKSVGHIPEQPLELALYVLGQSKHALVGLLVLYIAARTDYHVLRKPAVLGAITFGVVFLVVAVLIPGVGLERKGARRWLGVGEATFQPSELAKIALVLVTAMQLSLWQVHIKKFWRCFVPVSLTAGVFIVLVLMESDLGGPAVMCVALFSLLATAGVRMRYLIGSGAMAVGAFASLIVLTPYRFRRLMSFLDPWQYSQDESFQLIQSMVGFARGGIWGLGPGLSEQKLHYLPEAHNDFIFAILAEELGLIGTTTVLVLFMLMFVMALRIASHARDLYGALLAIGISSMITFQAAFNMAVTIGLVPTKGLPLPFISSGGTALIITLGACGVLINVGLQALEPRRVPILIPARPI